MAKASDVICPKVTVKKEMEREILSGEVTPGADQIIVPLKVFKLKNWFLSKF